MNDFEMVISGLSKVSSTDFVTVMTKQKSHHSSSGSSIKERLRDARFSRPSNDKVSDSFVGALLSPEHRYVSVSHSAEEKVGPCWNVYSLDLSKIKKVHLWLHYYGQPFYICGHLIHCHHTVKTEIKV